MKERSIKISVDYLYYEQLKVLAKILKINIRDTTSYMICFGIKAIETDDSMRAIFKEFKIEIDKIEDAKNARDNNNNTYEEMMLNNNISSE